MPLKTPVIIFSFVLISVFSLGSYFMHTAYLKNYKKDFRQYMSKNKKEMALSSISIHPSELYCNSTRVVWEDENKEVVYKGVLYDVVSVKNNGLTVELTLVSDEQEMEIKKQFAALYNINSHSSAKGPFDLLKGFLALKCIVHTTRIELSNVEVSTGSYCSTQLFNLSTKVIPKDSPPPDLFM